MNSLVLNTATINVEDLDLIHDRATGRYYVDYRSESGSVRVEIPPAMLRRWLMTRLRAGMFSPTPSTSRT